MLQVALKPLATLADAPPATGGTADTNDWDTVFALPFDQVNPAIGANWKAIEAKPDPVNDDSLGFNVTYTLDITFGPWQLALGGDGKNVDLTCPVTSGTYTVQLNDPNLGTGAPKIYSFPTSPNNTQIAIQVGMQWIPDPAEPYVGLSGSDVPAIQTALQGNQIPSQLVTDLAPHNITLSSSATVKAIDPTQPSLAWKITDGANSYYLFYKTDKEDNEYIFVYQFGQTWAGNLTVLSQQLDANSPPVVIMNIVNNPVPATAKGNAAILESMLSTWFNDNLDVFNHVFAALDISAALDTNDKWQWLRPTSTSYAVVDGGTLGQSVFGVLTMTGGRQTLGNHEISPNAIPADGSNAGFLISGPLFLEKLMLPGAMTIFDSTNASDFIVSNDGLSVTNASDLTWGPFITSDTPTKSFVQQDTGLATCDVSQVVTNLDGNATAGFVQIYSGTTSTPYLSDQLNIPGTSPVTIKVKGSEWYVVDSSNANNQFALKLENGQINVYGATQLHIPAKQFSMSLNHAQIDVTFVNLNYAYSSDFNVSINYSESWTLGLKEVNGRKIFWYTDVFNKGLEISVSKTQAAITREIVEGAIAGVLALIAVAGPIVEGLSAGAEVGEVTEEGGTVTIDAETFADAEEANSAENEADEASAGGEAADQAGGRWSRIKAAFKTPKWKAMGAIAAIAGVAAAVDPLVDSIIESAATNEWENVPTFDAFGNLCIAPYTFPNVKGFTLNSAQLADSLQIGLKVNS